MADTTKPVKRQIQPDPNDPSITREAVLVGAVLLVPRGSGEQVLTYQLSDGTLLTLGIPEIEVWRYYDGGSNLPSYKVDCKEPVCEAYCSPTAVDEYDRRLQAMRLGD